MLLLSACGWGPPDPRWAISVNHDQFVLWQKTAGVPTTIIGTGEVFGNATGLRGVGTIFASQCGPTRAFDLHAQGATGSPPFTLTLHAEPMRNTHDPHLAAELTGTIHNGSFGGTVMPLAGSMTLQNWCNETLVMNVEARSGPTLWHSWEMLARSGVPTTELTLYQTDPDANGQAWFWGHVDVGTPNCPRWGEIVPHSLSATRSSDNSFQTTDGATITLTNLPTTLNPDPPTSFNSTVSITGGPCDSQTFRVTLKSR